MIRVKRVYATGYYLFQGKASANSSFIEDLVEAKRFIILANYYFKGYLKIHEYLLTQDGWNFIVKINSLESIRKKLKFSDEVIDEASVWRLISEQMRILLSTFVKFTNKKQGRTGGKVHSSYERYMFETLGEAKEYIEKLRKRLIKMRQGKRKYRSKKSHYRITKKLGRGSIFISSRKLRKRIKKCQEKLEALEIKAFDKHVLRKSIISTLKLDFDQNPFHNSRKT